MDDLMLTSHRTPLGDATAAWDGERLCALTFTEHWPRVARAMARRRAADEQWRRTAAAAGPDLQTRLDAYFGGNLDAFDGLELAPRGTEFQLRVWTALRAIRAGATVSYGTLARRIDAPAAVRAVGAANGANPIWLIIPCHRAIGADGSLTGYAGGIERKRWLLEHESGQSTLLVGSAPAPTP